jgi:hypothetical protein
MADGRLPISASLWQIRTRASLIGCTLVTFNDVLFEVRLLQDADIVIAERFTAEAGARAYADILHEQVSKLAPPEERPEERKAG